MYYSSRTPKKTWRQSPVITVISLFLIFWGLYGMIHMYRIFRESRTFRDQTQAELVQMQEKEEELKKHIDFLSTDLGKEYELRNRYRVASPGEQLVIIVPPQEGETPEQGSEEHEKTPSAIKSLMQRFMYFIGFPFPSK